jgi:hypothetical protein
MTAREEISLHDPETSDNIPRLPEVVFVPGCDLKGYPESTSLVAFLHSRGQIGLGWSSAGPPSCTPGKVMPKHRTDDNHFSMELHHKSCFVIGLVFECGSSACIAH